MVAGEQRRAGDPAEQRGGDAGRAGGGDVDQVVAAFGEGLGQVGQARHAEASSPRRRGPRSEVAAGRRRSTPGSVPTTSTSKPGTPRSRICSIVWVTPCIASIPSAIRATRGRSPERPGELRLLGAEEDGRRRVGNRRQQRLEEAADRCRHVAPRNRPVPVGDRRAQAAIVDAAGAAVEVGVGEVLGLQVVEQLAPAQLDPDRAAARSRAARGRRRARCRRRPRPRGRRPRRPPAGRSSAPRPGRARPRPPVRRVEARARVASAIAACAHLAALPCSPPATASPRRRRRRNSSGVEAAGTSVKVRPMSTPAWSSEPPMPVLPWVST